MQFFVEHWDLIQDEATRQQLTGGNPMFGISEVDRDEHRNGNFAPFFLPDNDSEEEPQ
jgi:hypothetical protein